MVGNEVQRPLEEDLRVGKLSLRAEEDALLAERRDMVRLDLDRLVQHQPSYLPAAVALPQQPPETGERVCIMRVDPQGSLQQGLGVLQVPPVPGPRDLQLGISPERHDVTRRQIKSSLEEIARSFEVLELVLQKASEVTQGGNMVRLQPLCLLVQGPGLAMLAPLAREERCQVGETLGVLGVTLQALPEQSFGLILFCFTRCSSPQHDPISQQRPPVAGVD
mmetsp:Transcript_17966/g.40756  ORF Transcript_17966/g.40756 Transcript_17966/m.40756 type:complete len:221 (-) Transcript_17966:748-1410(-)